ncbi:DivIVA domain-containing protein [Quadrisphaera sp. DSM 44207]|uniref:DivIVA domain-containing protein n=1 Tax=Quadrisphaera sp. DSM 44207 TaxID=1881057 RepID=UPI00087E1BDC|nr:DivIVA domain-containing protein [Quadrisphaera sp. DSM 44207]SDQ76442.1 DivIVA domain-containing protein [Quadrisphaera sp. DSM 44207]
MATTFRRSSRLSRGYSVEQVEDFFAQARTAYEQNALRATLSSSDVRGVGFDLVLRGYDVAQVDAALDRMEDAFARREQEVVRGRLGADRALGQLAARAATLRGRLARPDGDRFDRADGWDLSYDPEDVDDVCARLLAFFEDGATMPVEEVRGAVFRTRRGRRGYVEVQVDAFLDRAVEVLGAVE